MTKLILISIMLLFSSGISKDNVTEQKRTAEEVADLWDYQAEEVADLWDYQIVIEELKKRAREAKYGEYKIQSIMKTNEGELLIFAETEEKEDIHIHISKQNIVKQQQVEE